MIVHLTNDVVDRRHLDVGDIPSAVAKYGGAPEDYVEGVHHDGDWRDGDGDMHPADPPAPPSDAERAASIRLRRAEFFIALDSVLGLGPLDPLPEDHLAAAIAGSALDDATKRQAIILVRTAGEFWRADPDAPGLMDLIGTTILGLTAGQIDAMFIASAST